MGTDRAQRGLDKIHLETLYNKIQLSRQEKLFMQVKHFNSEADELQSKIDNHNEFLNRNDDINNLDESRIQLMTMDVFDEDYKSSIDRLNLLKSRSEKIKNL